VRSELELRETARGVVFGVEVKVRASRSRVLGVKAERLSVALAAPPVDGAANAALCEELAGYFGVPKSRVRVVAGDKRKKKRVEIQGLDAVAVRGRLARSSE
jgi:uncharacterized protein (TIGR00251 family)